MMKTPEVPLSWGELIDKITILEIKAARLKNPAAITNVNKELSMLASRAELAMQSPELQALKKQLTEVNETLWEIEDNIRAKESAREFDGGFISLARSVYQRNDERAAIKRKINTLLSSELIEEKSYHQY